MRGALLFGLDDTLADAARLPSWIEVLRTCVYEVSRQPDLDVTRSSE